MSKLVDFFTNKKFLRICAISLGSLILILLIAYFAIYFLQIDQPQVESEEPQGLMVLIEFEGTEGLNNFVYIMNERSVPGLLSVSADFVEENCEFVKDLQQYDIEIAGAAPGEPFWDIPYEEQYETIKDTKDRIEACIGTEVRVVSSRYFAYDENTLKAADELGIEYVFARGTTGAKATIYKPEEYDVKIFSVSNIDSPKWGTGSLCDYSYWAREGTPQDFMDEVYSAFDTYEKVSPVSHTYLGGLKERWNEVYVEMFDNLEVNWVNLDTFGEVDVYASIDDIPVNREVQYTTPKPEIPLDEEAEVNNPCSIIDFDSTNESNSQESSDNSGTQEQDTLVMFHNGTGPMCIEAIEFFEDNSIEYEEYLTIDEGFDETLSEFKEEYGNVSEGESSSFGYYPMIFYKDKAFSGFNEEIGNIILEM
jgi:hypothetical protein